MSSIWKLVKHWGGKDWKKVIFCSFLFMAVLRHWHLPIFPSHFWTTMNSILLFYHVFLPWWALTDLSRNLFPYRMFTKSHFTTLVYWIWSDYNSANNWALTQEINLGTFGYSKIHVEKTLCLYFSVCVSLLLSFLLLLHLLFLSLSPFLTTETHSNSLS